MANDFDREGNRDSNEISGAHVAPLGQLSDFEVADGYPDVRGWDVLGKNGRTLGRVHELIVDTAELRTRYLDVTLYQAAAGVDADRDVLIPVGAARVDQSNSHILLEDGVSSRLSGLPAYRHEAISRDYENSVLAGLGMTAAGSGAGFYAAKHFDDSRFFATREPKPAQPAPRIDRTKRAVPADRIDQTARTDRVGADERHLVRSEEEVNIDKRRVEAGEVDVHKRVETEHVRRPIQLEREEVDIERRPVSGQSARPADIGDEDVRVPLMAEEPVVSKRQVAKEEVIIKKHVVPETRQVEADIRKERIDVDRTDRLEANRKDRLDADRKEPPR